MSRVRSVRAWGPSTGPIACAFAGRRCSLWGWRKGVPGGGAFHHCEGRLRSGAVPPPTARPLGGLLGSATHVLWARVCGCGGPTLSPWLACPVKQVQGTGDCVYGYLWKKFSPGSLVFICGFSKHPKSTAAAKEPQFHHCKNPKVLLFMVFEADDLESRCQSFT